MLIVFLFFLLLPQRVSAAVLFEDDFNDGNDDGWTKIGAQAQSAWHVEDGFYKARVDSAITVDTIVGDEEWGDYIIEFDMFPQSGEDKNIDQRWTTAQGFTYEIHFTNGGFGTTGGTVGGPALINGQIYHMKLILEGKNVTFYMNDEFKFSEINVYENVKGKVGLRVGTGGVSTEVWFDNFRVTTLDHTEPLPNLGVPLLKQSDPLWGNDIYDSANLWSSNSQGMTNWGCAVTSAAMVFQYNDLTKMPDNSDLTPGTMNSWLKSQPDGYIRNGLVNWLALSRLSKLAAPNNGVSYDALEYNRINGQDDVALSTYLDASNPPILAVPGHFIVANGKDEGNSTYLINDPYFNREKLSDGYGNTYSAIGTYTQVNSDLSYIMFVTNPSVNIELLDYLGDSVGESYIQEPIIDPVSGSVNSVGPVKIFILQKPVAGPYELNLSALTPGSYFIDEYFYDENGNVKKIEENGNLQSGKLETFNINLNKTNSTLTTSMKVIPVTFASVKQQIIDGYNQKKIKNRLTYVALLVELELARKAKSKIVAKKILNAMILTVRADRKIDPTYSISLIASLTILRDSL